MPNRTAIITRTMIPLAWLALGLASGYMLRGILPGGDRINGFFERREGGYRFINPLLECEGGRDLVRNDELRPFKTKVERYLQERKRLPGVEGVSVYFRELNDGIWFSIGETDRFTPASLRKVPMMIALLKQEERAPGLLDRKIRFQLKTDHAIRQTIKPSETMIPGGEYTVGDLIRRMIVHSDNNAFMVLSGHVDPQVFERTYDSLNMPSGTMTGPDDFLSVHTYASFFRVLYNATYLSKVRSEEALQLLTQSEFRSGIVAGVPPDVPVAHKFGEHRDDASGRVQLHDCGIVYYPQHPYLLCVMSKGTRFDYLDDAIAGISRTIYAEVNDQHHLHD